MKLNHINLTSVDVAADRAMFETYFGLHCSAMRGKALAIMHDEDGMMLVLNDFAKKRGDFTYPAEHATSSITRALRFIHRSRR